jgi:superfamily II RNA helicase
MQLRFNNIVKKLEKLEFIRNRELTAKGQFASKIYSDEIITTEIFASAFANNLTEYEILIILAMIAFEPKERDKFYKPMKHNKVQDLRRKMRNLKIIQKDQRFHFMFEMASLVTPCFEGKEFFDVLDLTNIPAGDLIRLFSQMIDRIRQIRRGSENYQLIEKMDRLQDKIRLFLNEVKEI